MKNIIKLISTLFILSSLLFVLTGADDGETTDPKDNPITLESNNE